MSPAAVNTATRRLLPITSVQQIEPPSNDAIRRVSVTLYETAGAGVGARRPGQTALTSVTTLGVTATQDALAAPAGENRLSAHTLNPMQPGPRLATIRLAGFGGVVFVKVLMSTNSQSLAKA